MSMDSQTLGNDNPLIEQPLRILPRICPDPSPRPQPRDPAPPGGYRDPWTGERLFPTSSGVPESLYAWRHLARDPWTGRGRLFFSNQERGMT